jgi:hypothetical protein
MMQLAARKADLQRSARMLLAWHAGDKEAFDLVLGEAIADPSGAAGVLLAMTDTAARLIEMMHPGGVEDQLMRVLLLVEGAPDD